MIVNISSGQITLESINELITKNKIEETKLIGKKTIDEELAQNIFKNIWKLNNLFNITFFIEDDVYVPCDSFTMNFIYAVKKFFSNNIKIRLSNIDNTYKDFAYEKLAPSLKRNIRNIKINVSIFKTEHEKN